MIRFTVFYCNPQPQQDVMLQHGVRTCLATWSHDFLPWWPL